MSKREAEGDLSLIPTLGDVAKDARFASLRELLGPVMGTPVTELSVGLRAKLEKKAEDQLELVLESFFSACDARAKAASLKRAHVGLDESAQGELQRFSLFSMFSSLTHSCLFGSAP
jgi:hypothetical protein